MLLVTFSQRYRIQNNTAKKANFANFTTYKGCDGTEPWYTVDPDYWIFRDRKVWVIILGLTETLIKILIDLSDK